MRDIAIVTGASSGLGREFVRQLDLGSGGPLDEIWAIARNEEALNEVKEACHTPVKVLALDLTSDDAFATLASELAGQADGLNVQWLVNCAGFGKFGTFQEIGASNAAMVKLNCLAVIEACSQALLYMHAGSRIVNIASAAALLPLPGLATYGATKRFVLDFTRALDAELGDVGIHATAVCPKFMHTKFLDSPGDHGALDQVLWIGFEDPRTCVSESLRAALRGKRVAITSPDVRIMNAVCKLVPTDLAMDLEGKIGTWYAQRSAR